MIDMDLLVKILEAALMTANKPMTIQQVQQLFEENIPDKNKVNAALAVIAEGCDERGIELVEVSSGWRFQVKQDVAPWVGRLFEEKPQKYSRATLETLALIAYRQPVTRGEIEEVRGVAVSSQIMRSLQEREWVKIVGHRDVPGRPAMYATTREFLDYLGLKSLENLPILADIRDLDVLNQELNLKVPEELLGTMGCNKVETTLIDEQASVTDEQTETENADAEESIQAPEVEEPEDLEGFSELIPVMAVESEPSYLNPIVEQPEAISVFDDHAAEDMAIIDAMNAQMADNMASGAFKNASDEGVNEQPSPDDERDPH